MHGFHHNFKDRVEDLARFLGIAVREQLHRALEVGKGSAKGTVTCFRSPSSELLELMILSARCAGVYEAGDARVFAAWLARPHSGQNFAIADRSLPQLEHRRATPVPHSSQNFARGRISWEQRGHFIRRAG
jgi:hypothetical protein